MTVYGHAEQRDGYVAMTDGGGPFFVTEADPERLAAGRKHTLKKAVVESVGAGIGGIVILLLGLLFLLA